jgi:hypothetical protein
MDKKVKKRGKPVTHPGVLCVETGMIYPTYSLAAADCGGSRFGVMRCCTGRYKTHQGLHFSHVNRQKID